MIISFTGTQRGLSSYQKQQLAFHLNDFKCTELVNGACIGADEEAALIAMRNGVNHLTFHPSNIFNKQAKAIMLFCREYGQWDDVGNGVVARFFPPKPPLERNRTIVESSKILLACPKEFKYTVRSGTWATIRYAWGKVKIGWQVIIIPPIEREEE